MVSRQFKRQLGAPDGAGATAHLQRLDSLLRLSNLETHRAVDRNPLLLEHSHGHVGPPILPLVRRHAVVSSDQSAYRHPGMHVQVRPDCVERRAADILEIEVDAVRYGFRQALRESGIAMIHAGVKAELFEDILAFLRPAGDSGDAAAIDLCDLSGHGAHRAAGRPHHHSFDPLRLTDFQ
jgi:hypothetical protein